MKTTISGSTVTTTLTKADRAKLHRLLERLGPHAKVPRMGIYKKLSSDDIWLRMVGQICVMGSARGMEKIGSDLGLRQDFMRVTSLSSWKKRGFKPEYIAGVLREFKATRFNMEAAKKLRVLVDAPSSIKGTRVVLLDDLPRSRDPNIVRDELMSRCPAFKRKSASDFMVETGISHDVIALDVRVVGALKKYVDYETPVGRIQGSKRIYLSVEHPAQRIDDLLRHHWKPPNDGTDADDDPGHKFPPPA